MLRRPITPGAFVLLVGASGCGSEASRYCEHLLEYEQNPPITCPGWEPRELVDLKTCREILESACQPPEVEVLQQQLDCAGLNTSCEDNASWDCLVELEKTGLPNDQCESAQDLLYL